MADIPGIIEGASEGKGLGLRFLRHIERNAILLFLVPADAKDIKEEYQILLNELKQFNPELVDKQRLLAISKSDMLDQELMDAMRAELPEDVKTVFISSLTGQGLMELKDMIWEEINNEENRTQTITHRNLEIKAKEIDEDIWDEDFNDNMDCEEDEEIDNYDDFEWDE